MDPACTSRPRTWSQRSPTSNEKLTGRSAASTVACSVGAMQQNSWILEFHRLVPPFAHKRRAAQEPHTRAVALSSLSHTPTHSQTHTHKQPASPHLLQIVGKLLLAPQQRHRSLRVARGRAVRGAGGHGWVVLHPAGGRGNAGRLASADTGEHGRCGTGAVQVRGARHHQPEQLPGSHTGHCGAQAGQNLTRLHRWGVARPACGLRHRMPSERPNRPTSTGCRSQIARHMAPRHPPSAAWARRGRRRMTPAGRPARRTARVTRRRRRHTAWQPGTPPRAGCLRRRRQTPRLSAWLSRSKGAASRGGLHGGGGAVRGGLGTVPSTPTSAGVLKG